MDRKAAIRSKMLFIRGSVQVTRVIIDFCNTIVYAINKPYRRFVDRYIADAPWIFMLSGSLFCMTAPGFFYPYMQPWITRDKRKELEEQRIIQQVQLGNDPHPFMRHKDQVFGVSLPVKVTQEGQVPVECSDEYRSLERYRQLRYKQHMQSRKEEEAAIKALEKGGATPHTTLDKWIRGSMAGEAHWTEKPLPEGYRLPEHPKAVPVV